MTNRHNDNSTTHPFFQSKQYQCIIYTGFNKSDISPMCTLIDYFIDHINLSYLIEDIKSDNKIGGRPALDKRIVLKMFMYSLYCDISVRQLHKHDNISSEFTFLSDGLHHYPERSAYSRMLNILDMHIEDIFNQLFLFIERLGILVDTTTLYCDGTVFEANNNRHKIITDVNIERSNTKWTGILNSPDSSEEEKKLSAQKLLINAERSDKLIELGRNSYGRTDEDCVILQDKNKSYIAGYNVQLVTESKYGLIVYSYISNKNPDSEAFLDIADIVIDRFHPKNFVLDAGYGSPEIMDKLVKQDVIPVTRARKIENSKSIINECSFELSEDEASIICPTGRVLDIKKVMDKENLIRFKSNSCYACELKSKCCPRAKTKSILINLDEFKALKIAYEAVTSVDGIELYSHRGNLCESPNGFIKHNLNGKKLTMNGLVRNKTITHLYAILYNLRRVISIVNHEKIIIPDGV